MKLLRIGHRIQLNLKRNEKKMNEKECIPCSVIRVKVRVWLLVRVLIPINLHINAWLNVKVKAPHKINQLDTMATNAKLMLCCCYRKSNLFTNSTKKLH